jgi:hypothetical protein
MLDQADVNNPAADGPVWEKVVSKLRSRTMPPVGRPRPDDRSYEALAGWLETALDRAAEIRPNPGRTTIHRLNRTEYVNAVRDLLAVEVDGRALLPPDSSSHGFDNVSDALSVSPGLLDRYLSAAWKISRRAIGDPTTQSSVEVYRVSPLLVQDHHLGDDFPLGSRGGIAIQHHFPLDGEYFLRIRLQRNYVTSAVRGLNQQQHIDVRVDGQRVKLFTIGGAEGRRPDPLTAAEGRGEYGRTADQGLDVRFSTRAGTRTVVVTFLDRRPLAEGLRPTRYPIGSFAHITDDASLMSLDHIQIGGPFGAVGVGDTPSRRRIFTCYPTRSEEEVACAKEIVGRLARRAYRRSLTDDEISLLMGFFHTERRQGTFESGIQLALERLLVDPNFLFRIEQDPAAAKPGTAYPLSDLELASRLSFFLWSSIPDDDLLTVAERGQLSDPATLERQDARATSQADAGRSSVQHPGDQLRRAVALLAERERDAAGFERVSGFRREPARRAPA